MNKPPNGMYRKPFVPGQCRRCDLTEANHKGDKACRMFVTVKTADRKTIVEGLRVWTNDLETGRVSLVDADFEWNGSENRYVLWFRVIRDNHPDDATQYHGGVLQSDDRVATIWQGKAA